MKKLLSIIIVLLMLSLAACAGKDKPAAPTAAPQKTEQPDVTQDAQTTAAPEATEEPLAPQPPERLAYDPDTDADNLYSCANIQLIEVDGGFYWCDVNSYYLLYYDEGLDELLPVCSKPECEHFKDGNLEIQNRSCDAYLEAVRHPTLYNGKLYYVNGYGSANPHTDGQTLGGKLYRMDPDGTHKEVIKDVFPPGFDSPQWVLIHRGWLYGTSWECEVVNGEAISKMLILALPLEGDETTFRVIYEFDDEAYGGLRFVGDRCYFWIDYAEGEYLEDEDGMPITDHYIPGGIIGCWDSREEKLHILFDEKFPQGEVDNFGKMWVTPDETVYVTVHGGLAKLVDGELVMTASFEDPEHEYCPPEISDGIVILREKINGRYIPEEDPVWWIMDFDGNTIYKGPLPVDWMDELGSGYRYAFDYIGGDDTGIYICFGLHQKSGDGEWHYLVRYDIEGGELITSIKGRLHWAPTEENW